MAYEPHAGPVGAIDAVLLDAGGVLILPHPRTIVNRLKPFASTTEVQVVQAQYRVAVILDEVIAKGGALDGVVLTALCRTLGVSEADLGPALTALRSAPLPWTWAIPDSVVGLRAITSLGVPVAVVSNAGGDVDLELAEAEVCQVGPGDHCVVGAIVDSLLVGAYKPHRRIFEIAAEALGVDLVRCVHVGDSIHADVVGAWVAGAWPMHFDPLGICPHREHHDHVSSLGDLTALLVERSGIVTAPGHP